MVQQSQVTTVQGDVKVESSETVSLQESIIHIEPSQAQTTQEDNVVDESHIEKLDEPIKASDTKKLDEPIKASDTKKLDEPIKASDTILEVDTTQEKDIKQPVTEQQLDVTTDKVKDDESLPKVEKSEDIASVDEATKKTEEEISSSEKAPTVKTDDVQKMTEEIPPHDETPKKTEDILVAVEETPKKTEEMPSFDEWKQRMLAEDEKSKKLEGNYCCVYYYHYYTLLI